MRDERLPVRCTALGLTLAVRAGDSWLPPVPDAAWRAAELMERLTRVAVLPLAPGRHRLALDCFGDYTVDLPAASVTVHQPPAPGISLAEVLEGPILLHALAAHGVHALHASAMQRPDGAVIAFTADSGTGKSSLAARAQARGWTRIADDLLALRVDAGQLVALPGLRQPKLAEAEQPGRRLPTALPLTGLYALRRVDGPARLQRLDGAAAFRLALSATVATRVYAPESLAAHLGFVAQFTDAVRRGALSVATMDLPECPGNIAGALDAVLELLDG
jgi:hypothetical protein